MQGSTLDFYNSHAAAYAADGNRPNPKLFPFLQRCKAGGRILELGTGGGVDAAAILAAGFALDATDGSAELAAIASRRLGQPVRTMLFQELDVEEAYDGVYACASLTHVARDELAGVIGKVHTALVKGGVAWASFKAGSAESADALGRHYNYLSVKELTAYWRDSGPWASLEVESWSGGAYDRRPTDWIAVTAIR